MQPKRDKNMLNSVLIVKSVSLLTCVTTLVGLVPRVSSDVLLEVGQLGELPLTDLAPVRLDAEVDTGVLGEVGAVGEGLTARGALVRFGFSHVDLSVELQVSFAGEYLRIERLK